MWVGKGVGKIIFKENTRLKVGDFFKIFLTMVEVGISQHFQSVFAFSFPFRWLLFYKNREKKNPKHKQVFSRRMVERVEKLG